MRSSSPLLRQVEAEILFRDPDRAADAVGVETAASNKAADRLN